jgi:hypothetical protein
MLFALAGAVIQRECLILLTLTCKIIANRMAGVISEPLTKLSTAVLARCVTADSTGSHNARRVL